MLKRVYKVKFSQTSAGTDKETDRSNIVFSAFLLTAVYCGVTSF